MATTSIPVAIVRSARRPGRIFASDAGEPRARRATDVILLVGSLVGLLFLGAVAVPEPGVERSFESFVHAIPDGLDPLWRLLITLLMIFSVFTLVTALVRQRWAVARDIAVAAAVAALVTALTAKQVTGSWPDVWHSLSGQGAPHFPPMAITVPTAAVIAVSPHLIRPLRALGRWLILCATIGVIFHLAATPLGVAAAVLVACGSASIVHLIFGSSTGRPSLEDVASVLTRLGISAHELGVARRQPAGTFAVDAVNDAGESMLIKVYGRDAHDTQLLITLWRTVWYRDAGSPTSFGRLQQAEHEALLTLLAGQVGIPTPQVVTASITPEKDVAIVLTKVGQTLSEVPSGWNEQVIAQAWQSMGQLHANGIVHGQLDEEHLVLEGAMVGVTDLSGSTLTPRDEQLRVEETQLLVASALGLDVETAVSVALAALGAERLALVLPFLQDTAITPHQRRQVKASKLDLDKVRSQAAERAGVVAPDLQKMRRVSVGSVLQTALLVFAFFALAAGIGGLDLNLLAQELRDATWWLVALGLILAQTPRVSSAVSVLGASPLVMPLGPVYALQLATSYIALAIPSSAARIAVNVRFFQRHGLRSGTALAVGGLDSAAQYLVQFLLLIGILALTPLTLHLSFDGSEPSGLVKLIVIVAIAAVIAIALVFIVPRWRKFVVGWIVRLGHEAAIAGRGLFRSPRRLSMLLGGNLATEILFALALQVMVLAFGYHVDLIELILINVSVSLLSSFLPIPGGIGVVEGGLTLGLVSAGMPEEAAFAAVILYRLGTFYLPPIWGFFALRWLEANKHL